eukprot:4924238-Pleurochrysis_carterae.AAC.1
MSPPYQYFTTSRQHPPQCGGGVLFSRAAPHDGGASVYAGVTALTHPPSPGQPCHRQGLRLRLGWLGGGRGRNAGPAAGGVER